MAPENDAVSSSANVWPIRWRLGSLALEVRMSAAGREASAVIAAAGIPVERIDVLYELDMHYLGQTHTVSVPLPTPETSVTTSPPLSTT